MVISITNSVIRHGGGMIPFLVRPLNRFHFFGSGEASCSFYKPRHAAAVDEHLKVAEPRALAGHRELDRHPGVARLLHVADPDLGGVVRVEVGRDVELVAADDDLDGVPGDDQEAL